MAFSVLFLNRFPRETRVKKGSQSVCLIPQNNYNRTISKQFARNFSRWLGCSYFCGSCLLGRRQTSVSIRERWGEPSHAHLPWWQLAGQQAMHCSSRATNHCCSSAEESKGWEERRRMQLQSGWRTKASSVESLLISYANGKKLEGGFVW